MQPARTVRSAARCGPMGPLLCLFLIALAPSECTAGEDGSCLGAASRGVASVVRQIWAGIAATAAELASVLDDGCGQRDDPCPRQGAEDEGEREAAGDESASAPFVARLALKSAVIDPGAGMDFVYSLKNGTAEDIPCDLRGALNRMRFVFSPVGGRGRRVVCPGPLRSTDQEPEVSAFPARFKHTWYSALGFPRSLRPNRPMDGDYPTPPPGRYRLRVVLDFPGEAGGWSGSVCTPEIEVQVLRPGASISP